ncbi:MAG: TonB-dependent receptor [Flavobacteriales bacterium 32-34-25]|nr:MAG: TonB-dependent receptor [Flavobacteriales bacterium 32-34-25]
MKLIFTQLIFFVSFCSFSQTQKGVVFDEYGNAIENAYVINPTSETHSHTDPSGSFIIEKTKIGDVLRVIATGFKNKKYTVVDDESKIVLEDVVLKLNDVVIQSKLSAMNLISKIDLQTSPVNTSQDILQKVPGLFIGQHAGGGKSEQLFLRGFDIDHGTDVAISVDGMPVNMVSHAHGQGYADLHFVIPETVDKIDYGKGAYYADKGDFATAGFVGFQTKEKLDYSSISVETGRFNMSRTVGLFKLLDNVKNQRAYIATEYFLTDGPFESPQNFNRFNLLGKYTYLLGVNSKFSISASHFSSKWDASGQIPERLVNNGSLSRFGAVDDTEGGNTSRTNIKASLIKPIDTNTFIKINTFFSKYDFELYSNFTFFLDNPINGDQIKQKENRTLYGMSAEINKRIKNNIWDINYQAGIGFRADATKDSELSHTLNRKTTLENIKLGDIDESNNYAYLNSEFVFGKWMINPGLRLDYFKFNYQDKLSETYINQSQTEAKVSPKLNFIYTPNNNLQFFVKSGMGFHSNDVRVVVQDNTKKTLPTAMGTDIGTIWKPSHSLVINSALWYMYLQQEFVYSGDGGIMEPSGRTKRMGADFGIRYHLNEVLYLYSDANYTFARSMDEVKGQDYIPLAPDFTTAGGINFQNWHRFSGGIRYRYIKNRPANEDNSIVAKGYFVNDMNLNYDLTNISFGISIQNLFDTEWNETQFATESRLKDEPNAVDEIHFTPGTPFYLKAKITYRF